MSAQGDARAAMTMMVETDRVEADSGVDAELGEGASAVRRSRRKRPLPTFLDGVVSEEVYLRWLLRKARAHLVRDRARGMQAIGEQYRDAIHAAVVASGGLDAYTGEPLDWHLISTYTNAGSQEGKHHYKAAFALLPTVDHVEASASAASFKICAWRTNDAKNDLSVEGFLSLCARVLEHAGYRVEPPKEERAA